MAWLILGIATLALLNAAGQIVGLYADWLWFREVRFTSVFVTVLEAQALVWMVTGAVFFLILYGNVTVARRLAPRDVLVAVDDAAGYIAMTVHRVGVLDRVLDHSIREEVLLRSSVPVVAIAAPGGAY